MIFKATPEQVAQIAVNAILVSRPAGMGFLHYNPKQAFETTDFMPRDYGIDLDYVCGRMVKLRIKDMKDGTWETRSINPDVEYQSWATRYSTYEALVTSVPGVEVVTAGAEQT